MRRILPLLLLIIAAVMVAASRADADPHAGDPPTVQTRWGWSQGTPAANIGPALALVEPIFLDLPADIGNRVTGPTALLYFSPTCPHCQKAMPELNELAALQPDLAWLGVAVSSATDDALADFAATYQVEFPIVVDKDRGFANATAARSTPSIYLVAPAPPDATPARGEAAPGNVVVAVTEAYMPYARGMGPVIAMRRNISGTRTDEAGQPLAADPFRDFQGYQGTRACAACHSDEATSWALTHHAGAYRTLYERDRTEDLQCVGCHVVGMGSGGFGSLQARDASLGGFIIGDHSSVHADVGCEACHGPAGPHDGDATATASGDNATGSCAGCHDEKHSVAFSVEKGMPWIDHYKSVGMDDETLRARLEALADGSAERPLLAFPTGPTAGAAACKSCHKAEHKGWSKHAHSGAMKTLVDADDGAADKPECARCHATQTAYGGMGTSVDSMDDLRTDEGVGCEACHGPGTDHVTDPRKDNIVHLGDSCPVCVLEGICTSCHTPQWDPTWDLDTRLGDLPY